MIDGVIPKQGVGLLFGELQTFKSFIALDLAISLGSQWAGRTTATAPVVYIGAEGAAGLRKRKEGLVLFLPYADGPFRRFCPPLRISGLARRIKRRLLRRSREPALGRG